MAAPHYVAAAAWLAGWVLLTRVPRLPPLPESASATPEGEDPVTVVIPARNEAGSLPLLLGDLEAALPPDARVLVVDDHSEDETAEVAAAFDFVEVVRAPPVEGAWLGKTWACHVGAERAPPGVLVFLDADVRLARDGLRRAVAAWRREGGLLTVWPYHVVKRPYEHLSALPTLVTLMGTGCGSLLPPRRQRAAFGPLMVTSTEAYERVGGHVAVRSDVVDDFALGRRYAEAGLPIRGYGGGRAVRFRMYPDGIRSLVQGWTKNIARGAGYLPLWRVLGIAFWLTCSIGALTWAGGLPNPKSVALYLLFVIQLFAQLRRVGSFGLLDALLYPVHVAMLLFVSLRSLWYTHVRRRVSWRGREVPVPRQRT